jgi:molybdenum cofactor cytidylyltransferase
MFSSIQCAAAWMGGSAELTHGAIALGDQPHLRSASLAALLEFARSHPGAICQPARRGRARHPVIIPAREFQNLAVSTLPNLREFLQSRAAICQAAELDDPGLEVDLDYPADYEEARCRFGDKAG